MRIVHIVVGKVNPESMNGVSRAVHAMATWQHRQGHCVEVWGLADSTDLTPRPREYTMRVFKRSRLRFGLNRALQSSVDQLATDDWMQFHSGFTPEFVTISRQLRRRGISYGITPHGGYAGGVFSKNPLKKKIYFALFESSFLEGARWVHTAGESEVEDLRRLVPQMRTVTIPLGQEPIPVPDPLPEFTAGLPERPQRPLIGYCGRLTMHVKGLDLLIRGFSAYKARGGKGDLWMIGDGEDRAALEAMAAQGGASHHIKFFGARFGQEKFDLVAGVDAFIHTSRWESMSLSCLEAAAMGRPLVLSPDINLAAYVKQSNAGLLLDETSAAGVERALERVQELYAEEKLRELGENGRRLIEREFSWEESATRFLAAVQESCTLA